ncbi:MAG: hypothetical protein CR972_04880 [Candidatus Moraniibacteriota bacterium]|nr:MAG: hypothetical protein CR972_04880 [Candidatus Moranbacteria bacterium]
MLISLFLLTPFHNTQAGTWGENFEAGAMKQMLEEISTQIREALASSAKMIAIKQATATIETLLYGSNSSPRNIKNFEEFLIEDPTEKAITYAEDFLTNSLRGTTSGDYISSGGGVESELKNAIQSAGESVINSAKGGQTYVNLTECTGNTIFSEGDFDCFEQLLSAPQNNPIGMALTMDQTMRSNYEKEKEIAELRATSSGALDQQDEKGNTVLPKSIVEEIQLQQITLPLEALANGDSSVFSSAIQAFAVTLITNVVNRGLSEVDQAIDENMNAFRNQYVKEMGGLYSEIGPVLQYTGDAYDYAKKYQNNKTPTTSSESQKPTSTPFINPDTGEVFVDSSTTGGNSGYGR